MPKHKALVDKNRVIFRFPEFRGALQPSCFTKSCVTNLWEGYHERRRCSRDTYPESCITKYTSIRRNKSQTLNSFDEQTLMIKHKALVDENTELPNACGGSDGGDEVSLDLQAMAGAFPCL